MTYTGIASVLRQRMNNHRSECRTGNTCNIFDKHVFNCRKSFNYHQEPFYQLYAFMKVPNENMLLTYENYLHKKGFDTMN